MYNARIPRPQLPDAASALFPLWRYLEEAPPAQLAGQAAQRAGHDTPCPDGALADEDTDWYPELHFEMPHREGCV